MYTRVLLLFMLSVTSCFSSTSYAQEQEAPYDYPDVSPYAATVIGTPVTLQAVLPKDIPVEDRELAVFPDRELPDILWYGENMRYSLVPQEKPAPLIFVITGTGAGYNSEKMQILQRAFFQAGFHVLSLSSPTHPDSIVSASHTGIPGHPLEDSLCIESCDWPGWTFNMKWRSQSFISRDTFWAQPNPPLFPSLTGNKTISVFHKSSGDQPAGGLIQRNLHP